MIQIESNGLKMLVKDCCRELLKSKVKNRLSFLSTLISSIAKY